MGCIALVVIILIVIAVASSMHQETGVRPSPPQQTPVSPEPSPSRKEAERDRLLAGLDEVVRKSIDNPKVAGEAGSAAHRLRNRSISTADGAALLARLKREAAVAATPKPEVDSWDKRMASRDAVYAAERKRAEDAKKQRAIDLRERSLYLAEHMSELGETALEIVMDYHPQSDTRALARRLFDAKMQAAPSPLRRPSQVPGKMHDGY